MQRDRQRRFFRCVEALPIGHRDIIDRIDGDCDGHFVTGEQAIIGHKAEVILTGKVHGWCIDQIGRNAAQLAVEDAGGDSIGDGIAIAVSGGQGDCQSCLFVGADTLGVGGWCHVDRVDRNHHRRHRRGEDAIADEEGKAVAAHVLVVGRIG